MKALLYNRLVLNWKSTLGGFLTVIVALSAAGFFAPNPFINTKLALAFTSISGMAKILLGVLSEDTK